MLRFLGPVLIVVTLALSGCGSTVPPGPASLTSDQEKVVLEQVQKSNDEEGQALQQSPGETSTTPAN